MEFMWEIESYVGTPWQLRSQFHKWLLNQGVTASYSEFEYHDPLIGITGDEVIELLLFVCPDMVGYSCGESPFQFPDIDGVKSGQLQMGVSVGRDDEAWLVADDSTQILHDIRSLVVCNPVFHDPVVPALTLLLRGIVEETSLKHASYAVFLTEVTELASEHLVVGKYVVAFGNGESVAGSDYDCVGGGKSLFSFI